MLAIRNPVDRQTRWTSPQRTKRGIVSAPKIVSGGIACEDRNLLVARLGVNNNFELDDVTRLVMRFSSKLAGRADRLTGLRS